MTPEQIKRAKRLAEILFSKESYGVQERGGAIWVCHNSGTVWKPFKPEQDKALLWDLQVKYELYVHHADGFISHKDDGYTLYKVDFSSGNIPAALIDCVIEVNGGYNEQS